MRTAIKDRLRRRPAARWGNFRRTRPFSNVYGLDRGTAVDRVYIEDFLRANSQDIQGRVLEVGNDAYTRAIGGARVARSDVLDIDPHNKSATVLADLGDPGSLPPSLYDCFVLTQTVHLVADVDAALINAWSTLVDGGVLLLTAPALSRVDPTAGLGADHWRFTPSGLELVLRRCCSGAELEIASYGNVLTSIAFLMGLAAEELSRDEIEDHDPSFPLLVCGRARKINGHVEVRPGSDR